MTIEVFIDYRQHNQVPAMVQVFIDANTGKEVNQKQLKGLELTEVFIDSRGRKVMAFKNNA